MTKLVLIARRIVTLGLLLLLPLVGCRDLEPEPGPGSSGSSEVEQQLPIIIIPPIVLKCDNIFSSVGCKGKVGGAACAPPAGGKCQPIAPIGNGFYDCLCAIPPPPPPPPPGDGGPVDGPVIDAGPIDGPVDASPDGGGGSGDAGVDGGSPVDGGGGGSGSAGHGSSTSASEAGRESSTLLPPGFCGPNGPFCDNNAQCGGLCGWPGGACNLTKRCCECYPKD